MADSALAADPAVDTLDEMTRDETASTITEPLPIDGDGQVKERASTPEIPETLAEKNAIPDEAPINDARGDDVSMDDATAAEEPDEAKTVDEPYQTLSQDPTDVEPDASEHEQAAAPEDSTMTDAPLVPDATANGSNALFVDDTEVSVDGDPTENEATQHDYESAPTMTQIQQSNDVTMVDLAPPGPQLQSPFYSPPDAVNEYNEVPRLIQPKKKSMGLGSAFFLDRSNSAGPAGAGGEEVNPIEAPPRFLKGLMAPKVPILLDSGDDGDNFEDLSAALARPTSKNDHNKAMKKAVADIEAIKASHAALKAANMCGIQEEVLYIQSLGKAESRLKDLNDADDYTSATAQQDEDDVLSLDHESPVRLAVFEDSDDDIYQPSPPPKKNGRKRKAVDTHDNDNAKVQNVKPKKARGKGKAQVRDSDGAEEIDLFEEAFPNSKKATTKPPKKAATRKAAPKKPKPSGPNMANMPSLFNGTDVFQDAAATAGLPSAPTFAATTRRVDAIKDLMTNIAKDKETKDVSTADRKALLDAIKAFTGNQVVKPAEGGLWSVQGMKTPLKAYQVLGVGFMRRREASNSEVKGGILADVMGLGKTLQVLCSIVNGLPERRSKTSSRARGTTLIVGTPAIVTQWYAEIQRHCKDAREDKRHGIGRVILYRPSKCNDEAEMLQECDIVLTTYHQIVKSYPRMSDCPPEYTTAKQKDTWWKDYVKENCGVFHRIKWLRVVLDEASAIKNHKSQTSVACRGLDYQWGWAVSGTPIMNRASEMYPYLKFIREKHTSSMQLFKENFCSPDDPEGNHKLALFLKRYCIRRTHLDRLFNSRLLDLPKPREHTLWVEFNAIERTIYDIVKRRFIARINSIARSGELKQKHRHIFSLFLRLRQLTAHILLCASPILDLLELEDYEQLNALCSDETKIYGEGEELLSQLRHLLASKAESVNTGTEERPVTENQAAPTGTTESERISTGKTHGLTFDFSRYLKSLRNCEQFEEVAQRALCVGCRQPPDDPWFTSCFHIYCKSCLMEMQHISARRGNDGAICSECGSHYDWTKACDPKMLQDAAISSPDEGVAGGKRKRKTEKIGDWTKLDGQMLPSAKTLACKAQLLNWLEEDPKIKTIIYTQHLGMIHILGRMCRTEGWDFCTYSGAMTNEAREKSIEEFANKPSKVVFLASLMAGGMGLNLTCATRVICVDCWFNKAVEQQAFCRVFRIGQMKETHFVRICVRNSIDDNLMQMKDRKQREIDDVVDSKKGELPEDCTTKELLELFGSVGNDGEGRPYIFPEQDDTEEGIRMTNVDENDEFQALGNEA